MPNASIWEESPTLEDVRIVNLLGAYTPYTTADVLQRRLHAEVADGGEDACIVAEFTPTYTAGRQTHPGDIVDLSLPVIHTDRGGSVTWHGPGQLVCYPIIKLANPHDVISYIRSVEAGLLTALHATWNLPVERIDGRAGIWLREEGRRDRKICAIGLKVARGATMHGFALNVHPDMSQAFTGIIPCGLDDADVATLAEEGHDMSLPQAAAVVIPFLCRALAPLTQRPLELSKKWRSPQTWTSSSIETVSV